MSTLRILYHMARADFYERTRRYSFLIMLGLIVYLGYLVNDGTLALYLDQYRGVFNSAWVGSMMALVANFFLGWFGFYLIKNSVSRDYETGVGQIMATTPMSRPAYMLGKWISNFVVLALMVGILALSGLVMQLIQREDPVINVWALVSPLLFVSLPMMALVAAIAVVFEAISWLRGGFGNVVYFFLFSVAIPVFIESPLGEVLPALEPLGLPLFWHDMGAAALKAFPDYGGGFSLGASGFAFEGSFVWPGINWTVEIIFWRGVLVGVAVVIALFAALLFDRFDTSKTRKQKSKDTSGEISEASPLPPNVVGSQVPLRQATQLSPVKPGFRFQSVFLAELKLLLKGLPWWWYGVALILIPVGLFNEAKIVREVVLPIAWIWPILIWSGLGTRESRFATGQMVFSAASPLTRQLPATFLAGVFVTALTGSGAGVRLIVSGDGQAMAMWLAAILFIPALALAFGVWTGTSKLFEVVYVVLWYLGPLKQISQLDYLGATPQAQPGVWLGAAALLLIAASLGRRKQLQV
jgi:hypothetical protein